MEYIEINKNAKPQTISVTTYKTANLLLGLLIASSSLNVDTLIQVYKPLIEATKNNTIYGVNSARILENQSIFFS